MSDSPDATAPTSKLSVHDNELYRYEFDSRTSTLVLHTLFDALVPIEYTDVWFLGVWYHHLEEVLGKDIILDVEESSVDWTMKAFSTLFSQLQKDGWPRLDWRTETLQEAVAKLKLRVWNISSSYGLSGFVIAKEMRMVSKSGQSPPLTFPLEQSHI
ncbi:hypothetical protein DES53_102945 [Roseimicrobium gellanilyticum]|uniref:Uncharacterized protein n=1 Tax=Roseimicrobium gellanilyticum TaxID=748857 RepID=A0A366HUH0_9BACT|nr:hypothetical protein [Roseimicrobium gellanilyticum]RBP46554.1 hypothetical protein DES53_102945 [Roseimicrobium gellanilyticum]